VQAASRYLTHGLVLLTVILVPVFTVAGMRTHGPSPVITTLAADRSGAGPTRGYIIKPVAAASSAASHQVQVYSVQQGDTLSGLGSRFDIHVDTIRWANNLSDVDNLSLGQQLLIPPVDGVLLKVQQGDTIESLASRYHSSAGTIIEFNAIRDPEHLTSGTQVMIPDGVGSAAAASAGSASSSGSSASSAGSAPVRPSSGPNHFPWGWCTWYVASRRYVPWNGDAHSWYANAQAYGYPVGRTPRPGAIMVTWESWWGHVAYVESVSGGCWTVSEMNYVGFGRTSYRHICPGQVSLIGFVY